MYKRNYGFSPGKQSRYRGVFWDYIAGCWIGIIYKGTKKCELGYFADERVAALAHDDMARILYGDRAFLNFGNLRLMKAEED